MPYVRRRECVSDSDICGIGPSLAKQVGGQTQYCTTSPFNMVPTQNLALSRPQCLLDFWHLRPTLGDLGPVKKGIRILKDIRESTNFGPAFAP